jgi:hypothetical protein
VRDIRPWTYAALFGSLWGAVELSLGTVLSAARIPFAGLLMAAVGVLCLVTARRLYPAVGMSLLMGVVAALLKVFSLGGFVIGPMIGILAEATVVELAMTATGSTAAGAITGGALALATAPLQRLLWVLVVVGGEGAAGWARALSRVAALFGWRGSPTLQLVLAFTGGAALAGAVAGAFSWRVAGRVTRRLRGGT